MKPRKKLHVERLESRDFLAAVAIYNGTETINEANVISSLQVLQHDVHLFTSLSANAIDTGLQGQDTLVFNQQINSIYDALTPAARTKIRDFVSVGNTVIVIGELDANRHYDKIINELFDFSNIQGFSRIDSPFSAGYLTADSADTVFENARIELGRVITVQSVFTPNLPDYVKKIYVNGKRTTVAEVEFGLGNVIYLGCDWTFPIDATDTSGWLDILDRSVRASIAINTSTVTPKLRNSPVDFVEVSFNRAIDVTTFSEQDIILTRDGGTNLISDGVTIQSVASGKFRINGLTSLTAAAGNYELKVIGIGINDSNAVPLTGSSTVIWTTETSPPTITEIINVTPNPRTAKDGGVKTIDVTFNEPIQTDSLTISDFTLTRGGGANLLTDGVTITKITPTRFRLGGNLQTFTTPRGIYNLTFNGSVTDLVGNTGTSTASESWILNQGPYLSPVSGSLTFTEAEPAKTIVGGVTVLDPESLNLAVGQLRVAIVSNASPQDQLSLRHQGLGAGQIGVNGNNVLYGGVVVGTFTPGIGNITMEVNFNDQVTAAVAQAIMRNVTFRTLGDDPNTLTRTVAFVMTDGDGGTSVTRLKTVNIIAVNSPPTINLASSANYTLNTNPIQLSPAATLSDVDNATFPGGKLTVTIATNANAADRLTFGGSFTKSGLNLLYNNVTIATLAAGGGIGSIPLEITINANATQDILQRLLRQIRFSSTAGTSQRRVEFLLTDGAGGTSNLAQLLVNVTG